MSSKIAEKTVHFNEFLRFQKSHYVPKIPLYTKKIPLCAKNSHYQTFSGPTLHILSKMWFYGMEFLSVGRVSYNLRTLKTIRSSGNYISAIFLNRGSENYIIKTVIVRGSPDYGKFNKNVSKIHNFVILEMNFIRL